MSSANNCFSPATKIISDVFTIKGFSYHHSLHHLSIQLRENYCFHIHLVISHKWLHFRMYRSLLHVYLLKFAAALTVIGLKTMSRTVA